MQFARFVIWLNALVFLLFGCAASVAPASVTVFALGAAPANASALIDARATYGGMSMAVGVVLFLMARDRALLRLGLISVIALMTLMASTRLLGIALDGNPNTMMWLYFATEVLSLGLAIVAIRKLPPLL